MGGLRVETSSWPEIEQRLAAGARAVLPIGAACKEHGRHLPMNTDMCQAEWIIDELIAQMECVVWPVVGYGYYPVFVDFPGSISLSERTFIEMIAAIADGIELAGAMRVILINTGISTILPIEKVIAERNDSEIYQLVNVYSGPSFTDEVNLVEEQEWGGHADEIETSIMLAIDDSLVDLNLASAAPVEIIRGRFNHRDPSLPNYSPDGVNGDPSLATRRKGVRLLRALMDDIITAIGD